MPRQKRGYGDGTIYEEMVRGKLKYVADMLLPNGKRKKKYCASHKEAQAALKEMLKEHDAGTLIVTKKMTVERFLWDVVYKEHIGTQWRHNTAQNMAVTYRRYIIPAIGHMALQNVTRRHIQNLVDQWVASDKFIISTVRRMYSRVHSSFEYAVELEMLGRNPAHHINLPPMEEAEEITLPKMDVLLATFHRMVQEHASIFDLIIPFTAMTGLRYGEVIALKWGDIDFEEKILQVKRSGSFKKGQGTIEGPTKTASSRREIPLLDMALEALHARRVDYLQGRLAAGDKWIECDYVFCTGKGTMFYNSSFTLQYRATLKRWNLPDVLFHTMRKIAGSLYLKLTRNDVGGAKLLGHRDATVTRTIYHKLFKDEVIDDMAHINSYINKSLQISLQTS